MKQKRAYKYRFYPTNEQKRLLAHTFGCCRFVYNWALRKKTDVYYKDSQRLSYKDVSALLTALKKQNETVWLADVSSVTLQQSFGPAPHVELSMTGISTLLGTYMP
jgi:putative transposase